MTAGFYPAYKPAACRAIVQYRLAENGVDIRTIQEITAHSSITITHRYMHPAPKRKLEAIEVLDAYK